MDKGKILNTEFNEVYDAISTAYDKMNEFYMKHCALGQNDIDSGFVMCDLCEIWDSLGKCKDIGHEVAEHFTINRQESPRTSVVGVCQLG